MDLLSKFFKGGSDSGVTGRRHPQYIGEDNMVWRTQMRFLDDRSRAEKEMEEIDRAIALSWTDDLKRLPGYGWQKNNDENPRALHDILNSSPYHSYAPPSNYPRGHRVCGGCNREIGYGNYLGCMGTFFHRECFRCRSCGFPITELEFSLSGRDAYHKSCFQDMTHPKCDVCHQFIPINRAGLIEYRCHPFWSQKYCPSHDNDNTARCCSCERLESRNARHVSLGDGRNLCLECMESSVMDTGDCQPLYHAIRDFYEGMNMRLDQQIPVFLVERQALNEAIVSEKNGFHHMPETRGLCLSEERTITSIFRGPRVRGFRLAGIRTQPQRLIQRCEVTAILVLYGLPRLLTGAILAHELMHAWLRLKGFRNIDPDEEEGICQVLSYTWLESETKLGFRNMPPASSASSSSSSSSSSSKKKLGDFFMYQIANDASPTYGGGYRAANAAVSRYGLRNTLDHIRMTGTLPV